MAFLDRFAAARTAENPLGLQLLFFAPPNGTNVMMSIERLNGGTAVEFDLTAAGGAAARRVGRPRSSSRQGGQTPLGHERSRLLQRRPPSQRRSHIATLYASRRDRQLCNPAGVI